MLFDLPALLAGVSFPALVLALVLAIVARGERASVGLGFLACASAAAALAQLAAGQGEAARLAILGLGLAALWAAMRRLNGLALPRPGRLLMLCGAALSLAAVVYALQPLAWVHYLVPAAPALVALACAREASRADFAPKLAVRLLTALAALTWAVVALLQPVLAAIDLGLLLPPCLLVLCLLVLSALLLRVELKLGSLGRIDPVSGWLNPLGLREAIELEVVRARRSARPFSLALVEAETRHGGRLQAVSDVPGLGEVARRIERVARAQDVLARQGSGQFAIVLPDTGVEAARAFAERLSRAVTHDPLSDQPLVLAIGLVAGVELAPQALLVRAEAALAEARGNSSLRVVVWQPLADPDQENDDDATSGASPLTRFLRPERSRS